MNKKDQKHFQSILERRKQEILNQAEITKEKGMAFDPDDLPDEVDLASSEADQSMNLRLRDRERVLLKKIDKALKKIEEVSKRLGVPSGFHVIPPDVDVLTDKIKQDFNSQ